MNLNYQRNVEEDEEDIKVQSSIIGSGGQDISFIRVIEEEINNPNNASMFDSLEGGCKYKQSRD